MPDYDEAPLVVIRLENKERVVLQYSSTQVFRKMADSIGQTIKPVAQVTQQDCIDRNIERALSLNQYDWLPDEFLKCEMMSRSDFSYVEEASGYAATKAIHEALINFTR